MSSTLAALAQESAADFPKRPMSDIDFDPAILADVPRISLTRSVIPEAIDLSPKMPHPVDQGEVGSCVTHSVVYAARGYYSKLENGSRPEDISHVPSVAYFHTRLVDWQAAQTGQTAPCQSAGSHAYVALSYLKLHGAKSQAEVPEENICTPQVAALDLAPNEFSIKEFRLVYDLGEGPAQGSTLDRIKQRLVEGDPVMIAMRMYRFSNKPGLEEVPTLQALKAGQVYEGSLGSNYGELDAGHAMTIVGFDEARQAFLVQNSWGDKWADNGFGWFSYEAIRADLKYAFMMDTGVKPPRPSPLRKPARHENIADGQCAMVYEDPDEPGSYRGFVETSDELKALEARLGMSAIKNVAVRPWPVCEAMVDLDGPMSGPSAPKIELLGAPDLKFGDTIGFSVTTPDFPSFLYLVYFQADGTVVNLVPRRGPLREQLAAGTVLTFGDGKDGRQRFRAAAPAGPEAIVAIAARSPLLQLEALEAEGNGQFRLVAAVKGAEGKEKADDRLFLTRLRQALITTEDAKLAAREVTADVVHLTITEK